MAIVALSAFAILTERDVRTEGDMGQMPKAFPPFGLPQVPLTWKTLAIIAPVSLTLAFVGLLEGLLVTTRPTCGEASARIDARGSAPARGRGGGDHLKACGTTAREAG